MKIFILKLLSLIVLVLGLVSLLLVLGVPQVQEYWDKVPEYLTLLQEKLPAQLSVLKGALTINGLWLGASVVAIVLGSYGFWPRIGKFRRRKKIAYEGPHGEVQIQLDSVEQSLNQVLARMPEIKKIDLRVDPHDGGKKARIRADVVLYQQPGQNARAIAALVSDYIAETATKLLGLEELATIDLNVVGISVNTRKSSKAVRKESLSHSANAPVELLEAAPAPLTLSGPNADPIGSEFIEEEIDEEAETESAMDTSAVDTKKEEAKQAAARSELLEPLNMGDAPRKPEEESEDFTAESPEVPAESSEEAVSPMHMDSLDESLDDGDDVDLEGAEDVTLPDEPETAEEAPPEAYAAYSENSNAVEAAGDAPESESPFCPPEEPGDGAPVHGVESEEPEQAASNPWESPEQQAANSDESTEGESPDVPVAEEETAGDEPASYSSDSVMGDDPGEVTIPEASEEEAPADETDKKRWGSWFN